MSACGSCSLAGYDRVGESSNVAWSVLAQLDYSRRMMRRQAYWLSGFFLVDGSPLLISNEPGDAERKRPCGLIPWFLVKPGLGKADPDPEQWLFQRADIVHCGCSLMLSESLPGFYGESTATSSVCTPESCRRVLSTHRHIAQHLCSTFSIKPDHWLSGIFRNCCTLLLPTPTHFHQLPSCPCCSSCSVPRPRHSCSPGCTLCSSHSGGVLPTKVHHSSFPKSCFP